MSTLRLLTAAFFLLVTTLFSSAQTISTMAGGGTIYLDNSGLATNARLIGPTAVAVDATTGDIYLADYGNPGAVVYKVTSGIFISIVAGTGGKG